MTRPRHVVLVGLMGAGKTTVGVPLARALGRPYRDNDSELERRTGRTAHDLAAAEGMDGLHRAESETLAALARRRRARRDQRVRVGRRRPRDARRGCSRSSSCGSIPIPTRSPTASPTPGYRPDIGDDARAFFEAQYAARAPLYREIARLRAAARTRRRSRGHRRRDRGRRTPCRGRIRRGAGSSLQ